MALSIVLSSSGAGATATATAGKFDADFRQQTPLDSKISRRFRNPSGCSLCGGSSAPIRNKLWSMPIIKSSNYLNLRNLNMVLAAGKDVEDNFLWDPKKDTDDMYDDLFKRYGKVVYTKSDQKPPLAEVDDDAESLSFAISMATVASDTKAADIKVLFVKPLVYWTRFFIISTAFSRPQVEAIRSKMKDLAEKTYGRVPTGDTKPNSWTLLDFEESTLLVASLCPTGDVVIHIFLPPQRDFYNLEEFYANATPVDLPFENQPPPYAC